MTLKVDTLPTPETISEAEIEALFGGAMDDIEPDQSVDLLVDRTVTTVEVKAS